MLENELTNFSETQEESNLLGFSYPDRDGEMVELDSLSHDDIVQRITKNFDHYDQQRSNKKRVWEQVERIVKGIVSEIDTDRFYALVPFGKQTVQTLVSHFWGRSLQSPKIFFTMDGLDEPSKEFAPVYKQVLMQHMEKDRVRQKMDKAIYLHGLMKGVIIGHVGTCHKTQTLTGPSGVVDQWQGDFSQYGQPADGSFKEIDKTLYNGATLSIVDPYDFVFDMDEHENWDSCFKALRKWMIYEDIAADSNYSNYEELEELAKPEAFKKSQTNPLNKKKNKNKQVAGVDETGRLEVVEFHGDFRLKDGTYLRNWTIVIAGRKKIIRFEQNPYFINPFVKWEYEPSDDGWSIPPVAYILGLVDASSILLSSGVEAAKLSINPPILATEGAFQQKKIFMKEGLLINYKPSTTLPNQTPQPLQFNYQAPFPFIQLFEGQSESATAATRQLSGNVTTNDNQQTATEFKGLQIVGNLVLDRLVDLFNMDFKIPVIEKISIINAIVNPEEKNVPIDNEKGVREFQPVTAPMYFGNYEFKIEDNKSEMERKQNLQEKLQFFTMINQDPVIGPRIKKLDLTKEYLLDFGYGNPGKYLMDDMEFVDWNARQNMIRQEIQIMTQKRMQERMMQEGIINEAAIAGLLGAPQGPTPDAGSPGMESVQQFPV